MMIKETFLEIISDIWPMLVIITVILVSLRLAYVFKGSKKLTLYKDLLYLMFIIYILCLFHVVTFQDVNFGNSNFVPFKEMFRYELFSPKFIRNVMGNVLLFVPFGFFVSYILKSTKLKYPIILTFLTSITIETVQYHIGRVFDIDDIILNILGGFIGYLIYIALDAISDRLPKFFKRDGFLNLLVIFIVIVVIIYVLNINIFSIWG